MQLKLLHSVATNRGPFHALHIIHTIIRKEITVGAICPRRARWLAALPGDQRRKSGLYFRERKEREEKTMYINERVRCRLYDRETDVWAEWLN